VIDFVVEQFVKCREAESLVEHLTQSKSDLEQFAYVASHDLQEPLRAVTNNLKLLNRYCIDQQLDQRASTYANDALDGAERMRSLIEDLLTYARVDAQESACKMIDASLAFKQCLDNLNIAINECHAQITHDAFPELPIEPSQLLQLFQNLIGNAIKYRGQAVPVIHVGVTKIDSQWQFSIRDNGIGFDNEQASRIFLMFTRLHNRQQYQGTGIGLALCKKIVERHNGRIWAESEANEGSTFFFTLPASDSMAGSQ
jgi:light-regulated signal transduction histidine kinase (bacteriophytochrome)